MTDYSIPIGSIGPGTQPAEEDGAQLSLMQMPDTMQVYTMPDIELTGADPELEQATNTLQSLLAAMQNYDPHQHNAVFDITALGSTNRQLLDQVLGEGEVSIVVQDHARMDIQESVLTGIWRVRYQDGNGSLVRDTIEVGSIPDRIRHKSFEDSRPLPTAIGDVPEGVVNAPALLAELSDKVDHYHPGKDAHVINLTLLPQTEQDIAWLEQLLGQGATRILSRGYGNCRINSTLTRNVWWVRYFNSQDALILNTLEVTDVPSVACASPEDIEDSHERLREILEVYL